MGRSCRCRQELSNECLLAQIGVDTAENEPSKVPSFIPTEAIQFLIDISPDFSFRTRAVLATRYCMVASSHSPARDFFSLPAYLP